MICSSAPEEGSRRGSRFQDQIVTSRLGEKVSKLQPGRAGPKHQIVYRLHRSPQRCTKMRIHSIDELDFMVDLRQATPCGEL